MKKLLFLLVVVVFCPLMQAQAPLGIDHQAVTRDAQGNLATNNTTGIRVSILQGSADGIAVYLEARLADLEEVFSMFTDTRDGSTYKWVKIGDQVWMAENLKYLPSVVGPWTGSDTEKYYYVYGYNGTDIKDAKSATNYHDYGVLYNWPAAMNGAASSSSSPSGVQGACPPGWHLPSDAEWTQLVNYIINQGYPNTNVVTGAGNALKSCRQVNSPLGGGCNTSFHPRWESHATHYGTDLFDFSALPGGYRWTAGSFSSIGNHGGYWSATEYSSKNVLLRSVYYGYGNIYCLNYEKAYGQSVRCLRYQEPDEETPPIRDVQQETIEPGESACFDALQTINVLDFTVQNGGSTIFVAGQSITFGPETVVESGGYLHAYITETGEYCQSLTPLAKTDAIDVQIITAAETLSFSGKSDFFKVFPTPTNGSLTLELDDSCINDKVTIEIYNILGNRVICQELLAERQHVLSLEGRQSGIYIIRVVISNQMGIKRIIKR